MKIYFLIWNTRKCGGHKIIFEHANRLKERSHQVKIFSLFGSKIDWFDLSVPVESFVRCGWIRKSDCLIATFWPTVFLSLIMPSAKKFYFVQGWEIDFYKSPFLSFLVRLTFRLNFQIITISKFLANKISYFSKQKIYLIPNAIDLELFAPSKTKKETTEKKRILSVVSNYDYVKGIDRLVNLIKVLKEKNPKFHFVLVSFEKKSYSPIFDEFICNPSPKKMTEEYQKADLFLLTPRVEGFSLPVLEAMACGCPVITTDSGGVREYAKNEINSLLVRDPSEILKKKLVEKILNDKKTKDRLIENGIKTAHRFRWEAIISEMEKLLFQSKKETTS